MTPQLDDSLLESVDKLLWELQLFTELHTPGMKLLLDKERAKYARKIQVLLLEERKAELEFVLHNASGGGSFRRVIMSRIVDLDHQIQLLKERENE